VGRDEWLLLRMRNGCLRGVWRRTIKQARGRGYCRRTIKIQQARGGVVVLQDNHHYRLGKDGGYIRKTPERLGQWSCMRTFMTHHCTFSASSVTSSLPFP
jgi:hypothetical protein